MVVHATPAPVPGPQVVASAPEESAHAPSSENSTTDALESLTLKELRSRAAAEGVAEDKIEDARDGDTPKKDVRKESFGVGIRF